VTITTRAVWAALATLVLSAGCTHMPWNPYRGWRAWKTNNVTVYADTVTAPSLTLEQMEDSYVILEGTFFRGIDVPPVEVIEVRPADDSPFETAAGGKKQNVALPHLAVAGGPRHVVLASGDSDRWQQSHVLTHHFIEAAVPGAPMWFHEGLAIYLMGFTPAPSQPGTICFGLRRPGRVPGVSEPIAALLATSWQDYNDAATSQMPFTAWGLVDYLLHGRDRTLVPDFRVLMSALAARKTGREALAAAYPADFVASIEPDMRAHVRRVEAPNLCPLPLAMALPRRPRIAPSVSPVPEATMQALFEAMNALPSRNGHADYFQ
jgi:hypothetical protein